VEPSLQLLYAPNPTAGVGLTDLMGVHATADRLYVTGLWRDTARVSYFPRDAITLPWCLHDGFGWPTGVTEHPVTGDIWVADMVYGLFVVTPPDEPGDCGCDEVVEVACPVEHVAIGGVSGLGGVAIAPDGRIFVSGLDDVTRRPTIWEVDVDGDVWTLDPRLSGPAVGDAIGLHVDGMGRFLYLASSDGFVSAYRILADSLGTGAAIKTGTPGYPTGVAVDAAHYYWPIQDPFAHPENGRGGAVLRTTLDGFVETRFGAEQLVWPAGVSSDGEAWFVVDRATGLWGYF
jgi:sugar lactone lactonase YvrE